MAWGTKPSAGRDRLPRAAESWPGLLQASSDPGQLLSVLPGQLARPGASPGRHGAMAARIRRRY